MIVGRNRHRPVTGDRIVVSHELACSARSGERVIAFIDDVVNSHEALSRATRELPDARSTDM